MRHCHGGTPEPAPQPEVIAPVLAPPPSLQEVYKPQEKKDLVCTSGYAASLDKRYCVKIPEHAHRVVSETNVWLCDSRFVEVGDECIRRAVERSETVEAVEVVPVKPVGDDFFDDFIEAQPLSEGAKEVLKEEVRKEDTGEQAKQEEPPKRKGFLREIFSWLSSLFK